jgi:TrmH family RNA methyltransferase
MVYDEARFQQEIPKFSAGTFFRVPVVEHLDGSELREYCNLHHIRMYRTDARAGVSYTEADLLPSCAILLGNEGNGMEADEFADLPSLHIPMAENTESINVAMAGAIILFEAFRQRLLAAENSKTHKLQDAKGLNHPDRC